MVWNKYITSKNIIIINDKDNYWYEFYWVQKPFRWDNDYRQENEQILCHCFKMISPKMKQWKINSTVSNWDLTYIALEFGMRNNFLNEISHEYVLIRWKYRKNLKNLHKYKLQKKKKLQKNETNCRTDFCFSSSQLKNVEIPIFSLHRI